MGFLAMILAGKGVPTVLSRFAMSIFSGGTHVVNKRWLKLENRPFLGFFELFTNAFTASLFGKTEYFSFFIDKILLKRPMTILKLGVDSPESGEHPRYPESMSGVPRKDFLINFQKPYFFEKAFFYTYLAYFSLKHV